MNYICKQSQPNFDICWNFNTLKRQADTMMKKDKNDPDLNRFLDFVPEYRNFKYVVKDGTATYDRKHDPEENFFLMNNLPMRELVKVQDLGSKGKIYMSNEGIELFRLLICKVHSL